MKNFLSFCFALALASSIVSCKKIDKLTQFDINYSNRVNAPATTYTATVPADTLTAPVEFDTAPIPTESANKFNAEKTSSKLIDEITLTKFNISVSQGNLNTFKSIAVYFKSSELGNVLIAKQSNIPAGSTSIVAEVQPVNIKEYIFAENMQFRIVARMGIASRLEQELKLEQTLRVKAKLTK